MSPALEEVRVLLFRVLSAVHLAHPVPVEASPVVHFRPRIVPVEGIACSAPLRVRARSRRGRARARDGADTDTATYSANRWRRMDHPVRTALTARRRPCPTRCGCAAPSTAAQSTSAPAPPVSTATQGCTRQLKTRDEAATASGAHAQAASGESRTDQQCEHPRRRHLPFWSLSLSLIHI